MPKPMRVGIIAFGLHVGGMERSMQRLCRCLEEEGYEVEFMTTEEKGEWHAFMEKAYAPVRDVAFDPLGGYFHAYRVGRELRKANYDVLFLFHARYAQAALQMLPDTAVVIPMIRSDDKVFYRVCAANSKAFNVVVGNSDKVCSIVRKMLPHRPVACIPNGIELPSIEQIHLRKPLENRVEILFVGRLVEAKGVLTLPTILKDCADQGVDFHCTILGDGELREELLERLRHFGMSESVTLCGNVAPGAVYEKMLGSHILLLPTVFEGLPNVLLEAQACGCVPIATHLEGITDMAIEDGVTGILVSLGKTGAFAEAVSLLATDITLWESMSARGQERVRQRFTLHELKRSYVKLIQDAMDGRYPLPKPRHSLMPVRLNLIPWRQAIPPFVKTVIRPFCIWRKIGKKNDRKP